jgi:predicted HicB family RNase H-like nuclease
MMEYRGYKAQIDFDEDAGLFMGEVINTHDGIRFQGRSAEELRDGFHRAVDDYIEWCSLRRRDSSHPLAGRVAVRLPPELHRSVLAAAEREGKHLSAWIVERLGEAVSRAGAGGSQVKAG